MRRKPKVLTLEQFNHLVYIISLIELERDAISQAQAEKHKDKGVW